MNYKAAVITVGNRFSTGERVDTAGPAVTSMLKDAGYDVIYTSTVPDVRDDISNELVKCSYEIEADIIITTGGTGFSMRDVTPEATLDILDREIPSIPQAMLYYSLQITPRAMLSRAVAGIRDKSIIINLPGSEKAARENLSAVIGTLEHALQMLAGGGN